MKKKIKDAIINLSIAHDKLVCRTRLLTNKKRDKLLAITAVIQILACDDDAEWYLNYAKHIAEGYLE